MWLRNAMPLSESKGRRCHSVTPSPPSAKSCHSMYATKGMRLDERYGVSSSLTSFFTSLMLTPLSHFLELSGKGS